MKKIVLAFCLILSFNVIAADGSSGCGPGWYALKDNSLISSALRATTNGILVPFVTLGMTFGTSKCSKHSIVKKEMEDLKFASENYFEIAADAAKGDGEFLAAYGDVIGCKQDSLKLFKNKLQKDFEVLFKDMDINPKHLLEETYKIILRDQKLRQSCFSA